MLGPIFMGGSHTWRLPFMYWNQQTADYYAGHCNLTRLCQSLVFFCFEDLLLILSDFLNKIVNVPNLAQLCQSLVFFCLKICYSPVTANKHIDNIEWYFGKQNFSSSRCHMFLWIYFWNPTRIVGSSRILFSCQFIQLNSFGAIYPYNLIRIWKDSKFLLTSKSRL